MGINRLSIGVQSFQDSHLTFLGRIHTALEAETLIESARNEGFTNLGIDLIYGLPGQCAGNWLRDLHKAVSFAPAHLSCYLLSFEEGTPLHASLSGGFFTALDEGLCARLFTRTMDTLKGLGYHHYEISNFARSPETISRHNSKYWDFEPYRGFGPSAHSYVPSERKRYWNVRDVNAYIAALNQDRLPVEDMEILTPAQQMTEALFLSLRKRAGIDVTAFNARFGTDFRTMFAPVLDSQIQNGMVAMTNDRVYLTVKGILFADRIAEMFAGRVEDEQQTIKP
jgi:oxygen-independent coproporphyrinogen-3 oxidase